MLALYFYSTPQYLQGQKIVITGKIYAEETREPLAFANLYFGSTELGFYSDFEGNFSYISDSLPSDTLKVRYMGYQTKYLKIRRDTLNYFDIEMKRAFEASGEVVIKLKVNPALKWVRLAQDNRLKNNPDKLDYYQCESFSKTIIAMNNISPKLKNRKIGRELGSVFDTISYRDGDGTKSILPVFLSEVISNYYFNKNPYLTKEEIIASRLKGVGVVDGSFVSQFMGASFVNYNFYQNTLIIVDKGVVSPISDIALGIYDYSLINVDRSGPRRVFQIYCEPKNDKDLAFKGFIWIEDTTGAMLRLSLELNNKANLNYIEKLRVTQEYKPTSKGAYFCVSNRAVVDGSEVTVKAAGLVATSTVTFKDIDVNTEHPPKFFETRVTILPGAMDKPDSFWLNRRHYPMNPVEKRIASRIDTLVNMPKIRSYVDVVNFLVDGYFKGNKWDIGPYYSLVSYNQLEGLRLRLGFRSSVKLSRNWLIEGYGAYGLQDKRWKYSLSAQRIINRKYWTKVGGLYRKDVEQIGIMDNDNYLSGLFTAFNLLGSNTLTINRDARLFFGTDIRNGLRVQVTFGNRHYQFYKVGNYNFAWLPNFTTNQNGDRVRDTSIYRDNFTNSTINFTIRYSPRNYFLQNDNRRVNFSSTGAEWYGIFIQGIPNVLKSDFLYSKVVLGLNYSKVWGAIGRTAINIESAAVFGTVPYPLLTAYIGNQSFWYNPRAYNQMRIFEFISDRSIAFSVEHHLNGLIFNRVPGLRQLKWREVIGSKMIYGQLNKKNFEIIPQRVESGEITQFKTINTVPYFEVSAGIENIFKMIRVDAVWRLTYRDQPKVRNFGIKASVALGF